MEIKRIQFKPKIKKMFNIKGICYIKLRGSYYFLEDWKADSLGLLRKNTNCMDKTPEEFYNIIHQDFLIWKAKIKKTNIAKKPFYSKLRITRAKERINKLKKQVEMEEINLRKLKGGLKK